MTMPHWAPQALALQLMLTFFAPPIAIGTRNVFASDVWCFLWTAAGLWYGRSFFLGRHVETARSTSARRYFLAVAALVAIVYVHGYWRPSLIDELRRTRYFSLNETDLFNAAREFVVATRFLCWILAARLVFEWFSPVEQAGGAMRSERAFSYLCRVLSACLLGELAILVIAKVNPAAQTMLAKLYGYDPNLLQWVGRGHGTFRSPLEAGMTMAFGGLILASRARKGAFLFWDGLIAAVAGIWLTHTGTAAAGFVAIAGFTALFWLKGRRRWIALGALAVLLCFGLPILHELSPVVRLKWVDFKFRFMPWAMYLNLMASRLDLLLLGLGFAPYHTDNAYLFVLNRSGLIGFAVFFVFVVSKLARWWGRWAWSERSLVIYILVSGLALDVFIYRPVVALMLAAGLPALAGRFKLP